MPCALAVAGSASWSGLDALLCGGLFVWFCVALVFMFARRFLDGGCRWLARSGWWARWCLLWSACG